MNYNLFLAVFVIGAANASALDVNAEIHAITVRIDSASGLYERVAQMQKLESFVSQLDADNIHRINGQTVDEVAGLLLMDADVGRFYGAKILAALGCQARRALPALRVANVAAGPLPSDSDPMVLVAPAVSDAAEVRKAIAKIESDPSCNQP